jgi:gluconate 5-dehydrogenase
MSVRNLLDLSGKTAIVTGGSRGIGLQMAAALGEMGAKVALTARTQNELDEARTGLESTGVECLTIAGDLADSGAIPRIVDLVLAHWG